MISENKSGGATYWATDLRSKGRGFDSLSGRGCVMTINKLLTLLCPGHRPVSFGIGGQRSVTACRYDCLCFLVTFSIDKDGSFQYFQRILQDEEQ